MVSELDSVSAPPAALTDAAEVPPNIAAIAHDSFELNVMCHPHFYMIDNAFFSDAIANSMEPKKGARPTDFDMFPTIFCLLYPLPGAHRGHSAASGPSACRSGESQGSNLRH